MGMQVTIDNDSTYDKSEDSEAVFAFGGTKHHDVEEVRCEWQ